jgi:hypothetical protein
VEEQGQEPSLRRRVKKYGTASNTRCLSLWPTLSRSKDSLTCLDGVAAKTERVVTPFF